MKRAIKKFDLLFFLRGYLALLTMAVMVSSCANSNKEADLVIRGGTIYTMNDGSPLVEAIAVRADTIVYAGNLEGVKAFEGSKTKFIDLAGKTLTPGWIESHGHFMGLGYNEMLVDLTQVKSYEELAKKVKEAVAKRKPGEWILGRGWHQDKWTSQPSRRIKGFQTHELLSSVSPDNPVFLRHASGHAGFANEKAMRLAGVYPLSKEGPVLKDEAGGEIIRDANGAPTGIFNEGAMELIDRIVPKESASSDLNAALLAVQACLRNGITSFQDAGSGRDEIELYQKMKADGSLINRLYVMLSTSDRTFLREWLAKGPMVDSGHQLTIRSVKIYCDGALGTRGAWLLKEYADQKDAFGMARIPMDSLLSISRSALLAGFQVCTHAIGDRANREVLDRYEQIFKENPSSANDRRFRIEHAQHIDPADIPRFGQLGVIASMQAIHMSSDRPWAIDRLGERRIREGAYMWQSLLKSGARVINGTDVPVEPINPVANYYASVTRKTLSGKPDGGYGPDEKMTREQALRAYTLDAAYGAFEEKFKGSIVPGKLADFTVFSQDIMTVPDSLLLKTEVKMTIVGGKVVYEQ